MLYWKLGWRSLWRNKRRSVIELSSIAGAVWLAVAYSNLAQGSYAQMIAEAVRTGSGHIGFYQQGYLQDKRTEQVFQPGDLLPQLDQDPEVASAFARLNVPGLARSGRGSRPVVAMGMDFAREAAHTPWFRDELVVAGAVPGGEPPGRTLPAVVGARLAEELGIDVGHKFVWMAQDAEGVMVSRLMRARALVRTGVREIDGGVVVVDRGALATAIGRPGAAHEVAVMLHDVDAIGDVLPRFRKRAAALDGVIAAPWRQAMPGLADAIGMDYVGLLVIVVFIYLLVGIGTINTMLMSVMERTREFGVIRALGIDKAGVRRMVLAEAVVLAGVGVGIGTALAAAVTAYLSTRGLDLSGMWGEGVEFGGMIVEPIMYSTWDVATMIGFPTAMIAIAVLAALYPASRAIRERPATAMRHY